MPYQPALHFIRLFCSLYVAGVLAVTMFADLGQAQSSAARAAVPGAPAGVTAFVDVAVVPMDAERVLHSQTVLVEGGRITALGSAKDVPVPAGAVRIDGRGKYLIPGLADMHAHIQVTEERIYGDTDSAKAINRLQHLWLANGVTTIRNLDYDQREWGKRALQLRARAAAGELLSPRIYTSGPWTGMDKFDAFLNVAPEQVADLVAAYKAAGYDHIKVHEEGSRALWDSLVAAARREELPIVGHLPRTEAVKLGTYSERRPDWALAAPMKSIEHLHQMIAYDTTVELPAKAVAIKRAGIWLCPTWSLLSRRYSPAHIAFYRRFFRIFQDSGVGFLLGTDNAYRKAPVTVHDELRGLVEEAGLTPYEALLTGTRNVAEYFGTLNETGTVAVGKRADLVLLRGNPLANIRHTAEPVGTMIGGRWITRAELAPRWAGLQRRLDYRNYLTARDSPSTEVGKSISLTKAQRVAHRQLNREYWDHGQALLDSLVSVVDTTAGHARLFRLIARKFANYRRVLTSDQQVIFDANARAWLQQRKADGYDVTIPGLRP